MGIKGMWKDLRTSPVDTLVRWQEQRLLWLLMAVAMGALIILAHSFFQIYLYMAPCEQCVYIRYAMFVMVIGGLVAAINPKNIILKLKRMLFHWPLPRQIRFHILIKRRRPRIR